MQVLKNTFIAALGLSTAFAVQTATAMNPSSHGTEAGKRVLERGGELSDVSTLKLCVDYYKLTDEAKRKQYIKELDLRTQLAEADHENVPKHKVVPGMTMCGMYMSIGTPKSQKTKQLRPMVYKTVHVYEDMYYVTQSGLVLEMYERKEGEIPPRLQEDRPRVAPSPTLKP